MHANFKGFEAHGSLNFSLDGRILKIEGIGPWNLESLKRAAAVAEPLVEKLKGKPWAAMVILHGESIHVPAAADKLIDAVIYDKTIGRKATAVLVNDCDSPNFAKLHLGEIYTKAGETYEYFDDIDLAKKWLTQQIENSQVQLQ